MKTRNTYFVFVLAALLWVGVAGSAMAATNRIFPDLVMRYPVGDPGATNPISDTEGPKTLIAADMNNDGRADVISGNLDGSISVLLGQTPWGLEKQILHPAEGIMTNGSIRGLVAADFNQDGKIDIAAADIARQGILMLLGKGNGELEPYHRTPLGPARALATADFNRDGKADLLVACSPPECEGCTYWSTNMARFVAVLFGNGDGTFQTPNIIYSNDTISCFYDVAAADMNQDGQPDIMALDFTRCLTDGWTSKRKHIVVFVNQGDGTFTTGEPQLRLPTAGEGPRAFTVAYLDEKMTNSVPPPGATLDIVVANRDSSSLDIYLNHGSLDFGDPITVRPGDTPRDIGVGDLDGNGYADLVVVNRRMNTISILPGLGGGSFGVPKMELPTGVSPRLVAMADYNGDGVLDAAINNRLSEDISLFLGQKGLLGFMISQDYYPAGIAPISLVTEDFNQDNYPDVATVSLRSHEVRIRLNQRDGTLGVETVIPVNFSPVFLAAGDLNGDDKLDLVVTCLGASESTAASKNGSLVTLLGNGDGTFKPMMTSPMGDRALQPFWLRLGDLSGDGVLDAAIGSLDGALVLFKGNNDGTFAQGVVRVHRGDGRPLGLALGDFDRDGQLDIATSRGMVLMNNGEFFSTNSSWSGKIATFDSGWQAWAVETEDLDKDGILDLMVALTFRRPDPIGVFFGKGDGSFHNGTIYEGPDVGVVAMYGADMDGDGIKDIVIGNRCAATVILLRGLGNRLFEYGEIIPTYSVEDVSVTDINRDGLPDILGVGTGLWVLQNGGTNSLVAPRSLLTGGEPERSGLFINEVMALNERFRFIGTVTPDWVEIYNHSAVTQSLVNWSLVQTTAEGINARWVFPPTASIPPWGHQVVYCTRSPISEGELRAPFELSSEGETISLQSSDGALVDRVRFPAMPSDVSYARYLDGARYFSYNPAATLGSANLRPGNLPPRIERKDPYVGPGSSTLGLTGRVFDDVAVAFVGVCYRRPGESEFHDLPLDDDGHHGDKLAGDGYFGNLLPGFAPGTKLEYFLRVVDLEGQTDTSPDNTLDSAQLHQMTVPEPSSLRLTELVAANSSGLRDENGEYEDWIELVNAGSTAMSLDGLGLSKDYFVRTNVWAFPRDLLLAPGQPVIVYCDEESSEGPLHAGFRLLREGDRVYLLRLDPWTVLDSLTFGALPTDTSYGVVNNGTEANWLAWPTPLAANIPLPANENSGSPAVRLYSHWISDQVPNSYFAVRWQGVNNVQYRVEWSEDLSEWHTLGGQILNLGQGLFEYRDNYPTAGRFYRVLRLP